MTISVSTCCCSSSIPASAERPRRLPFERERLGHHTDGQDALIARRLGDHGRGAPFPVPPPMPAAMKHMCAPSSAFSIASIVSSAAARPISGPRSGAQALRDLDAQLDAVVGGGIVQSLRVGVGDDEVDALGRPTGSCWRWRCRPRRRRRSR
jgi:hypothetical protein